jgi:hypothetical protein
MTTHASIESPRGLPVPIRSGARRAHRVSALLLGTFGVLHLANHPFALAGPSVYQSLLDGLRHVYRTPLAEALLYTAIGVQVVTGGLLFRRSRAAGGELRWRRYSGAFLSFFLVAHALAAQYQRHIVGLDSNVYWAAAVLVWPWALWFVPYYLLGVCSFVVHVAGVLGLRARWAALLGIALGAATIAGLAGIFHPVEIPAAYRR